MAGKIFISYRRSETAWAARALFERLWREFPGRVFIDLEGIDPGEEFPVAIERHLEDCHAMVAVIGPTWLEEFKRRFTDEHDYVRIELTRALDRRIPVIPVLVDGAPVPNGEELPFGLKPITRRHALRVDPDTFEGHAHRICRVVEATLARMDGEGAGATIRPRVEPWMSDEGRDDFGCWAELRVNGVVQRLRWIEPGEFWMGPTEAELKRFGGQGDDGWKNHIQNEAPRHRVKLTRGFWLADTACTQALWQTVVGDNPSHFAGDLELPVERVSWEDVAQKFLPVLSRLLVGAEGLLPTEAQWEYACRAGTETAYHFGEQIRTDWVNYDGNFPPPGGRKDENRQRTVPVKALPANAWGLYQMHGNVWEWCADARRTYGAEPIVDPDGGQNGAVRVLRGGSWSREARKARSAFRNGYRRGTRFDSYGFRFALTSIELGAGGR